MKKLLKAYNLNSDMAYYELIVTSILNEQMSQAKLLFCDMPKANKIAMLKAMTIGNWNSCLPYHKIAILFDLI